MRNPLIVLIMAVIVVFAIGMGVFYVQEGSFEDAGARMDDTLVEMKRESAEALENAGEATEDVVNDIREETNEAVRNAEN